MNKMDTTKQEEALIAIELWRESGLSQNEFCRRESIHRSTFQHWRRRYDADYDYKGKNKKTSKPTGDSFISLEMKSVTAFDPKDMNNEDLEIIYKNDVRIKCSLSIPLSVLQKLINLEAH